MRGRTKNGMVHIIKIFLLILFVNHTCAMEKLLTLERKFDKLKEQHVKNVETRNSLLALDKTPEPTDFTFINQVHSFSFYLVKSLDSILETANKYYKSKDVIEKLRQLGKILEDESVYCRSHRMPFIEDLITQQRTQHKYGNSSFCLQLKKEDKNGIRTICSREDPCECALAIWLQYVYPTNDEKVSDYEIYACDMCHETIDPIITEAQERKECSENLKSLSSYFNEQAKGLSAPKKKKKKKKKKFLNRVTSLPAQKMHHIVCMIQSSLSLDSRTT